MSISTKQLGLLLLLLVAITLTLAWVIERRQILSFRQELDAWGRQAAPPPAAATSSSSSSGPGTPDDPAPFVPPPADPTPEIDEG